MRFPGATGAFALFGEVLLTGLLITVGGILLVTLPAALAAGIRHLRRYLNAEASPQRQFWRDYLKALPGGLVIGVAGLLLVLVLILDIDLAGSGALPGGIAVAAVGWVGLAAVAVTLLAAAGAWTPGAGWRAALRGVPAVTERRRRRGALPRRHGGVRVRRDVGARAPRHSGSGLRGAGRGRDPRPATAALRRACVLLLQPCHNAGKRLPTSSRR